MKVLSKKYLFLANEPVILEKELCIEYGHRGLYQDLQKRVLYRVRRYIWIIASVILGILAYLLIFSSSTSAHNKIVRNNITQLTFWFFENGDITNIGTIIFEIILSLAVTVFLWHLTKPSIDVSVVEDKAGKESKYLHVKVSNKGRFLFINRETTYETTGEITFTNMNTNLTSQSYFPKWASKSNPLSPVVIPSNVSVSGRPTAHIRYSFDETKIANSKIEDIYSGSSKFLDIAVKFPGESEFYAMTPENFADTNFKPSDRKIIGEKFLVHVKIMSENGAHCDRKFILENGDATLEGFLLKKS